MTFTTALSAVAPGAGTPTGSVQFKVDAIAAGAPSPLTAASASYAVSTLTAGTHVVLAEYGGDANFAGTTNSLSPVLLVNTPPMAGTDTIYRSGTNDVKVTIAQLLANDHDPDGDTTAFAGVDSTGASGGTVSVSGNWIRYTPPAGSTNGDSFTYSISDSHGASVTGTVLVTVLAGTASSPNLAIATQGNGSYLLSFDGVPELTCRIEYSADPINPAWQPLSSATADGFGHFQYLDTPPTGTTQRYYRSVYP